MTARTSTRRTASQVGGLETTFQVWDLPNNVYFFSKQIRRKVVALRRKRRRKTKGSRIKTAAVSVSRRRRRMRRNKYGNVY